MAPAGVSHVNYTLAGLSIIGGIAGYAKKRSVPSLIGGLGIGAAFALSGYLVESGEGLYGHGMGTAASLLLTGVMGKRLMRTRTMIPAGMLTALGLAGTLYNFSKAREWAPA